MPPSQAAQNAIAWLALYLSVAAIGITVIGWFVVHFLSVRRDRQLAKDARKAEWTDELSGMAAIILAAMEQGRGDWFKAFLTSQLPFRAYVKSPPIGMSLAIVEALTALACITNARAATAEGKHEIANRLEALILLLRPK